MQRRGDCSNIFSRSRTPFKTSTRKLDPEVAETSGKMTGTSQGAAGTQEQRGGEHSSSGKVNFTYSKSWLMKKKSGWERLLKYITMWQNT